MADDLFIGQIRGGKELEEMGYKGGCRYVPQTIESAVITSSERAIKFIVRGHKGNCIRVGDPGFVVAGWLASTMQ